MDQKAENIDNINSTNVRFKAPAVLHHSLALLSRLSPPLAGRVAAELFCHAKRTRRSEAEIKLLEWAESFTFTAEGYQLAAWAWGYGPVVLLVHGWSSRGSQLGAFVTPLVKAGFKVVTFDAPGHGDSPGRVTNGFQMGRICRQMIDDLGGVHAVVGHSLGSSASGFAMLAGARVERAVFLNPPVEMDTYAELFRSALGFTPEVMQRMISRFEDPSEIKWRDFEPANLARGQTAGLLVVSDRDDRRTSWRGGQAIAEAWPEGRFHLTEGLGHSRVLTDRSVVEKVVEYVAEPRAVAAAAACERECWPGHQVG